MKIVFRYFRQGGVVMESDKKATLIIAILTILIAIISFLFGSENFKIKLTITAVFFIISIVSFIIFFMPAKKITSNKDIDTKIQNIKDYYNDGKEKYLKENYKEALLFLREALKLYEEFDIKTKLDEKYNIETEIKDCISIISDIYSKKYEKFEYLKKENKKTLSFYRKLNDKTLIADIYMYRGDELRSYNFMEKVYKFINYKKALYFYKKDDNKKKIADIYCKIVFCYNWNSYKKIINKLNMALDLYTLIKDRNGQFSALSQLSTKYKFNEKIDLAIELLKKALEILNDNDNDIDNRNHKKKICYSSLGYMYLNDKEDYYWASFYYKKYLDIALAENDSFSIRYGYEYMYNVYSAEGDENKANEYLILLEKEKEKQKEKERKRKESMEQYKNWVNRQK
jgi:tetratricopeptide (TPR) repeat protein